MNGAASLLIRGEATILTVPALREGTGCCPQLLTVRVTGGTCDPLMMAITV